MVVVLLLRYPVRVAFAVAVALAQIGEFSFILAALGRELGVLPPEAMNTIVAVAIVSIVLNPPLYRALPASSDGSPSARASGACSMRWRAAPRAPMARCRPIRRGRPATGPSSSATARRDAR